MVDCHLRKLKVTFQYLEKTQQTEEPLISRQYEIKSLIYDLSIVFAIFTLKLKGDGQTERVKKLWFIIM